MALGIDPAVLRDPDNVIPYETLGRLLNLCAIRTACAHFGLLVGQLENQRALGTVGFLAQNAPNVAEGLASIVRYLHIHDRGGMPALSVDGETATLSYTILESRIKGAEQIAAGAVAIACNIMRFLCGPSWSPIEASFTFAKPRELGPYHGFFKAPVRFDCEVNALVFPTSWLSHPIANADPGLYHLLERQIRELGSKDHPDFPTEMRALLTTQLLAGHSSIEEIAKLLSVHRRTLHRRLKAYNTTYAALLEDVRYQCACRMLQESTVPLAQIAARLDYSDLSAFTRAFRRWSGTTPARWRATIANE